MTFIGTVFYYAAKFFFRALFVIYNRLEVRGFDNIPVGRQVIVASNHASNVDPPLIGGVFPGRLRYLAKESLFRVPLLGFFIRVLGAIPVAREDSQRAGAVIKLMLAKLKEGESILIFPEGTRSESGVLKPLEGGVALLSVMSGVPVLPVYVGGSHRVCPAGKSIPRPVKLTITFSRPVFPSEDHIGDREKRGILLKELEGAMSAMREGAASHD
ncbi:MAG: 1-acyl-sn-glycerol-3-phosphate acyltransferase [Synergistaceae bacterium]|jgi:1-acyl-sn-glycerol-3-phosphate acyltransferase|nr:1-acyl-sn-glycerol-3-phosphate acyltransferase [Synergistaceae bacterium]